MTGRNWLWAAATAALLACGEADADGGEPQVAFSFTPDTASAAAGVNILRMDRQAVQSAMVRLDGDVLLPYGMGEATARATLQHVVDSLAAADTMAAAIRLTGYMLDPTAASEGTTPVNPVIMIRWVPLDTVGVTGSRRTAVYRSHFVLLEPLPGALRRNQP